MSLKQIISSTLHDTQTSMPLGQNWNLHSKSTCDALSEKIIDKLNELIIDINNIDSE